MNAFRNRDSSMENPTMMELQRIQLQALRDGDEDRVSECQEMIYRRLEEAQAAADVTRAA